jgi:opacity protein-like surface antigen
MLRKLLAALTLAALLPAAAHAASATSIGPRIGFSVDPDQLVLGGQLKVPEVAPKISFDPSLELGVGDDVTLLDLGFNLHYNFDLKDSRWTPYVGAGVSVVFIHFDNVPGDDSDTDIGGNIIVGAAVPTKGGNQFFAELKFGLGGNVPSLKMVAGWNFPM